MDMCLVISLLVTDDAQEIGWIFFADVFSQLHSAPWRSNGDESVCSTFCHCVTDLERFRQTWNTCFRLSSS